MHAVKRVEIIANSSELTKILEGLDDIGAPGYTVIRNVTGKGIMGNVSDDDVTTLSNVYVLCYCSEETIKPIVETIRPILNKFGGVCYVSDAMEMRSVKCVSHL
ncbi:P-II family nitrogen regulator [Trichothermofontia sp.]